MISVEGAGLVAQVYPVAILVLALELRSLQPLYAASRIGAITLWSLGIGLVATVLLSAHSVLIAVEAVGAGARLAGWDAALVAVAGHALFYATILMLLLIIADRTSFLDRLAQPAARRFRDDPEYALRQLDNMRRYHPELRLDEGAYEVIRAAAEAKRRRRSEPPGSATSH